MVTETIFNLYPIIKILGCFFVVAIGLFLLHSAFGINLFVKKDEKIAEKFLDKFPLVSPEFMKKSVKAQNIENNQEIHEINKRFDKYDYDILELKETMKKIVEVLGEIEKRG